MTDRMTAVHLPGLPLGSGFANYGRRLPAEMIEDLRRIAREHKAHAEAILAAADADFYVETYVGVHKQRDREVLQVGRAATAKEGQ
jgi:hypothetical protein